jgi:glyoxylase-like metal-dependent hydrolase (beta-lactamase superfamily II)/rhodanese-related sulfurtransferase
MKFKQFYLGCLSHASYYVGSEREAVVIDPQRDVQQYLDEAQANNQEIKYIIETHFHADFVSGHRELAEKTGAKIIFGAKAKPEFDFLPVKDGAEIRVGKLNLKFLETPGHTPEGISILATDMEDPNAPQKLFTGDTLFIGDVGRPDLVGSVGFTAQQMGAMLYESLHEKILKLSDDTEIYPAHGAGSLCGKNLSSETWSTLGEQRKFNYALKPMSKEEFIKVVAENQPEVPMYFLKDVEANMKGAPPLEKLPKANPLSADEVSAKQKEGAVILDVRTSDEFGGGHVAHSLNIGLGGQFASWAGTTIRIGTPIILVANNDAQVEEAQMRLARVGLDTTIGFLDGGVSAWEKAGYEVGKVKQITVEDLKSRIGIGSDLQLLDVRRVAEFQNAHAPTAKNVPLSDLMNRLNELDKTKPTTVICAGGYRSSLATSILAQNGFREIENVIGGTSAYQQAGFDCVVEEEGACAAS